MRLSLHQASRNILYGTSSKAACRAVQVKTYNAAADLWQRVRGELAVAMSLTGAGNDIWRTFWAGQQRFFKLLCVSLKVPAVVAAAKAAIEEGHCVVVGLQSTGAAHLTV